MIVLRSLIDRWRHRGREEGVGERINGSERER
jgi:hypothetical protein